MWGPNLTGLDLNANCQLKRNTLSCMSPKDLDLPVLAVFAPDGYQDMQQVGFVSIDSQVCK